MSNFSYPATLYCISEAISVGIAKSKKTAENKQTADITKISNILLYREPLNGRP